MFEKFKTLTNFVEFVEKHSYNTMLISSFSEEICLVLEKKDRKYFVFLDMEDEKTKLIKQVLLEKGDNEAEQKYYSNLETFKNVLRSKQ